MGRAVQLTRHTQPFQEQLAVTFNKQKKAHTLLDVTEARTSGASYELALLSLLGTSPSGVGTSAGGSANGSGTAGSANGSGTGTRGITWGRIGVTERLETLDDLSSIGTGSTMGSCSVSTSMNTVTDG
jgi:hypothetical protein